MWWSGHDRYITPHQWFSPMPAICEGDHEVLPARKDQEADVCEDDRPFLGMLKVTVRLSTLVGVRC
ncbi:hypothetical protein TYRP_019708 [Tyrophagus putrescentiae]|nr:hypothetical protein TYRP_019708 [Tyrophagus putrescentiae]